MQFFLVAFAKVISHHRNNAHAHAVEYRDEQSADILAYRIGADSVVSQIADQLKVVDHGNQRVGDRIHHFGTAVVQALPKSFDVHLRFHKMQFMLLVEEIHRRNDRADQPRQSGRDRCAPHSPFETCHKKPVQQDVGHRVGNRGNQPQAGPVSRYQQRVKRHRQHLERHEDRCAVGVERAAHLQVLLFVNAAGTRMYRSADSKIPTAISTPMVMLSNSFARSFFPSPSSLEIRALAPVPNIRPTDITISSGGKIRFSASNAASPI